MTSMNFTSKSSKHTKSIPVFCLLLAGCGGGGGGGNETLDNTYYEAMPETYANEKYAELGDDVSVLLAHEDGLGNSERDIADLNRIMMDRGVNGDLFIAYDAEIISLGFDYLSPDVWAGSLLFSLYIDNDNDITTGKTVKGIGADIKLNGLAQYVWNSTDNTWDSTWFESTPPFLNIRTSNPGSYIVRSDIATGEAYIRVIQSIGYLDALTINTNAKAVLQIQYSIIYEYGFYMPDI